MKKILFASLIGVISITSAYAKCDGGTEVTNTAGTTFCKSNVALNWWSAAAWCKENGLHLATMYEMCPSWDGNSGSNKCPELSGTGNDYAWSATARKNTEAFPVRLSDGYIPSYDGVRNLDYDELKAFCR